MRKKYELLKNGKIVYGGTTLYRIKALVDIPNIVKAGELGGYIESEKNLSHERNCWVADDAKVYGDARVYGKVKVGKDALILSNDDYATISGFGRENRTTTFYLSHNNIIMVDCGCFNGNLEEFRERVKVTHGTSSLGHEYAIIADLMEMRFNRVLLKRAKHYKNINQK